jgi:hypothetical protein
MTHNQTLLNEYFSKTWKPGNSRGLTSHERLATLIHKDEWVLDAGCGENQFKQLGLQVVGIDPAFEQADIKCTIEDYIPDRQFDVATCLGSINFGSEEVVARQIAKVVSCLKTTSRVYWRLNPGRHDHGNEECNSVPFFPWTFEKLREYACQHNYIQTAEQIDEHPTRPRLYAEWHRAA